MKPALNTLRRLIAIDSPTGYTGRAAQFVFDELTAMGWKPRFTTKGAVACVLGPDAPLLGLAGHIDTLGAIVSGINGNGTLSFSLLGSPLLPSFEGAYVRIHTLDDTVYTGTMLFNNPSAHANRATHSGERKTDSMHIRIDERVQSRADVEKLGIRIGDIVAFDTRYEELPSGFVKSHFLDNKAGCLVLLDVARAFAEQHRTAPVELFFSNYEEVGHGGTTGYSSTLDELLVIDMGVIGDQLDGRETMCSICAKDSAGPYDYEFRRTLVRLAVQNNIPYVIDVYPFYSSDGSAAWSAGVNVRVALIGPGVAASHGMERTHIDGIAATTDLCIAYIDNRFNNAS
jgi:putative aminopeptidase FrvX